MKGIFKHIPKKLLVVFGLVAAVLVPTAIMAWGPNRATFTMEVPSAYNTFNSITNNPVVGDERNFVNIREAGSSTWTDAATIQDGKEYEVRMYVHNNKATNYNQYSGPATNVRAAFDLPSDWGTSFDMNGFITAEDTNPAKIWDNVTASSSKEFKLNYVAGSARYYNKSATGVFSLGNELFTSQGALLGYDSMNGQIKGCLPYSGYVLFRIKPEFKPVSNPNFEMNKKVRVQGQTEWKDNVTAQPGDTLEYRIEYKNTGNTTQNNVIIKDTLPAGVTYVAGSSVLYNSVNPSGKAIADGVTTSGINVGNYVAGSVVTVQFKVKIADNDVLPKCGTNVLRNVASVKPDGQNPKEDDATTDVPKECQPDNADFTMNKKVRVEGQTEWKDSVTAQPGATLEYKIEFKNIGDTTLNNVIVKDTLPAGVTYVDGSSKLYNNANQNGKAIADGVTTANGVNIGNYAAGETASVVFKAKLPGADKMACGDNKYHNVASVKTDGQNPKDDDADTIVPKTCQPNFEMNKKVRVAGQTEWKDSVTAKPGDTLEYQIEFKNTGETTLNNVIVRDTLPYGVTYIAGSTKLFNDANQNGKAVADGVVTASGINIGNYEPGKTAKVQFSVKIADNKDLPKCGDNLLKNIASVQPDGQNPKTDDADTTVPKDCEKPPVEPKFECKVLDADKNVITRGDTVNFTIVPRYVGDKVTIKEYKMDFGDMKTAIKDNQNFAHMYPTVGSYTAQAWVTYNVDGKTETVTSEACKKPITVNEAPATPVTPTTPVSPSTPGYIPATGNEGAIAGAIGAGAITLGIASWLTSRRVLRSLK